MCFYIHPDLRKVKIAEKDIICYKILERRKIPKKAGVFVSPHLYFIYDFNNERLFKVHKFYIDYHNRIYDGLHSYSSLKKAKSKIYSDSDIFQCIIPKGTKYYYNPSYKEYVSLQIKFIKRLTFNLGKLES